MWLAASDGTAQRRNGNLTQRFTVLAKGEVAALADTITGVPAQITDIAGLKYSPGREFAARKAGRRHRPARRRTCAPRRG